MRILYITDYIPFPPKSGDRIRVYNLLWRVAKVHQVTLAVPVQSEEEKEFLPVLNKFCEQVITGKLSRQHPIAHLPGLFQFAVNGKPLELKFLYSKDLERKIRWITFTRDFDIVQIEHSRMAFYLESISPQKKFKSVLDFHNIASIQYKRIYPIISEPVQKFRAWLFGCMMAYWEPRYASRFDQCITVSEPDRTLLLQKNPKLGVNVIPNGVDTDKYRILPFVDEATVLMIGTMEYPPCADMAIYFCHDILPAVREAIPDLQTWVVGANPTQEVCQLNATNIHVTGEVKDVLPYYERSSICVVPLRAGGGTRLKILEAMALGRPVVSTSIGCEGIAVKDGIHILIADDPLEFAKKVISLLVDRDLYAHIVNNARRLVEERYGWDAIADDLLRVYDSVMNRKE